MGRLERPVIMAGLLFEEETRWTLALLPVKMIPFDKS